MSAERTLIFIPTYNERENAALMCERLHALKLDADILFVDDSSPDGTGELLEELTKTHPRLKVMHRSGKLGIGSAHLDGIAYAYDHGYRRLVTLDCDFTHSPEDIPRFLEAAIDSDIVVGSRFRSNDSLPGWSPMRRALTHLGHVMTRNLLGVPADATGAFRVYRLDRIPRGFFDLVTERGYAFFFQSLFIAVQNRLRIREIDIVLPARTYGHSKMSMREVSRSVRQLGELYLKRTTNPAQFRMPPERPQLDPKLVDPQGWDSYWEEKGDAGSLAYDIVATAYRNIVIKSNLASVLKAEFEEGAKVLHAGCGSGQLDAAVRPYLDITGVDISPVALSRYLMENPGATVKHASILDLPYENDTFDGAFNLGVVEHFEKPELSKLLKELARVTKPGGKVVIFWPHRHATSVMFLNSVHFVLNDVLKQNKRLHPPEVSLIESKRQAEEILGEAGLQLDRYTFGPRDLFVQAVVVGRRAA